MKSLVVLAASLLLGSHAFAEGHLKAPPEVRKEPRLADQAQKLKTEEITVGGKKIIAEIADNDDTRERGLMYRKFMRENEGMLFVFDRDESLSFWMKNTLIPLAIGYFDSDRKLIEVIEMVPAPIGDMYPKSYPASKPARYALEMNKGWYARHGVKPGAELVRARPLPGK